MLCTNASIVRCEKKSIEAINYPKFVENEYGVMLYSFKIKRKLRVRIGNK